MKVGKDFSRTESNSSSLIQAFSLTFWANVAGTDSLLCELCECYGVYGCVIQLRNKSLSLYAYFIVCTKLGIQESLVDLNNTLHV